MLTSDDLNNIYEIVHRYNKDHGDYESKAMLEKLETEIKERHKSFDFIDSPETWELVCELMKHKKYDLIEQLNKSLVKDSIVNADDYKWEIFNGTFDPKNYYYRKRATIGEILSV